jgi:hypothetical protein
MFEHLVSAIQLSKHDPFQLHDSKLVGPASHGSSRPTHKQYLKIRFWSQDNSFEWLDTASSQTTDCERFHISRMKTEILYPRKQSRQSANFSTVDGLSI